MPTALSCPRTIKKFVKEKPIVGLCWNVVVSECDMSGYVLLGDKMSGVDQSDVCQKDRRTVRHRKNFTNHSCSSFTNFSL